MNALGTARLGTARLAGPASARATRALTVTANPTDGETVTVGSKTYTFRNTADQADEIYIEPTADASIQNLASGIADPAAAIALGQVGPGTVANPRATASSAGSVLTATARAAGTGGNSIATTETLANGSWAGATLTGGS